MALRVLVVDNYDSFVYNLVQYLSQLGAEPTVVRNDADTASALLDRHTPDGVLISPGPGTPESAGISIPIVHACIERRIPVLGVCLGHQAIGVACGAVVDRAPELLHGKTSVVEHKGEGVLAGLPSPFTATRYHSLAVMEPTMPAELEVTGRTTGPGADGVIMAMRHRTLPLEGVQFHPESVLTEGGYLMLANWLDRCGDPTAREQVPALSAALDAVRAQAAFTPA